MSDNIILLNGMPDFYKSCARLEDKICENLGHKNYFLWNLNVEGVDAPPPVLLGLNAYKLYIIISWNRAAILQQ